jgi:hypothetical protein
MIILLKAFICFLFLNINSIPLANLIKNFSCSIFNNTLSYVCANKQQFYFLLGVNLVFFQSFKIIPPLNKLAIKLKKSKNNFFLKIFKFRPIIISLLLSSIVVFYLSNKIRNKLLRIDYYKETDFHNIVIYLILIGTSISAKEFIFNVISSRWFIREYLEEERIIQEYGEDGIRRRRDFTINNLNEIYENLISYLPKSIISILTLSLLYLKIYYIVEMTKKYPKFLYITYSILSFEKMIFFINENNNYNNNHTFIEKHYKEEEEIIFKKIDYPLFNINKDTLINYSDLKGNTKTELKSINLLSNTEAKIDFSALINERIKYFCALAYYNYNKDNDNTLFKKYIELAFICFYKLIRNHTLCNGDNTLLNLGMHAYCKNGNFHLILNDLISSPDSSFTDQKIQDRIKITKTFYSAEAFDIDFTQIKCDNETCSKEIRLQILPNNELIEDPEEKLMFNKEPNNILRTALLMFNNTLIYIENNLYNNI